MHEILSGKQAIFFDVGYTLDYPASGDWILTNKFYELCGQRLQGYSKAEIGKAKEKCFAYLDNNHLVTSCEAEYRQFRHFYAELSGELKIGLTNAEIDEIAHDRTYNMGNYVLYPDAVEVLKTLSQTFKLGIISDTWPSIEAQLQSLDIRKYFTTTTYSCHLGTFKPDRRMYLDALAKMGVPAGECVFIDDCPENLAGAAELDITPILIAANPASDVDAPFTRIHSLTELLQPLD